MTPCEIGVLLHYCVTAEKHPNINAPAVQEALHKFITANILTEDFNGTSYELTKRGYALVKLLRRVEFPKQAWVDSNGNIIE